MNEKGSKSSELKVGAGIGAVVMLQELIPQFEVLGYDQLVALTWLGCFYIGGRSLVKFGAALKGNHGAGGAE